MANRKISKILPVVDVPLSKLYGNLKVDVSISEIHLSLKGLRGKSVRAFFRNLPRHEQMFSRIGDFSVRELLAMKQIGIEGAKELVQYYQELASILPKREPLSEVGAEYFDDGPANPFAPAVVQHNNQIYLITDLGVYPLLDQLVEYNQLCAKQKQMLDEFTKNR
jgi:hypothetical protein